MGYARIQQPQATLPIEEPHSPCNHGVDTSPLEWTEDCNRHVLTLKLPESSDEAMKLEICGSEATISRERKVTEGKCIEFERTFKLPDYSDGHRIQGELKDRKLTVDISKHYTTSSVLSRAVEVLDKNKGLIFAVSVSLTFGLMVSRKINVGQ